MAHFRASASDIGLPDATKALFWIDCIDGSKMEPLTFTGADLERLYYILGRLNYFDRISSEITLPLYGADLLKQSRFLEDATIRYMDRLLMEIDQDVHAYVDFLKACDGVSSKGNYIFVQIRLEDV